MKNICLFLLIHTLIKSYVGMPYSICPIGWSDSRPHQIPMPIFHRIRLCLHRWVYRARFLFLISVKFQRWNFKLKNPNQTNIVFFILSFIFDLEWIAFVRCVVCNPVYFSITFALLQSLQCMHVLRLECVYVIIFLFLFLLFFFYHVRFGWAFTYMAARLLTICLCLNSY